MVNVPLELLKLYFQLGLHYKEIVWILAHNHGIIISLRHLKRKLLELGLYRRKQWTNYCEVVAFVKKELQASGQLHGYRMMHAKCISNGLEVRKEDVRLILSLLDPAGVQSRRRGRLRRRAYYAVFGTFSETLHHPRLVGSMTSHSGTSWPRFSWGQQSPHLFTISSQ